MLKLIIILTIFVLTPSANACRSFVPLRLADVLMADEVFVGEVTGYKLYKPKKDFNLSEYGIITFKVINDITGKSNSETKEVYWHNSTFGMPTKLNGTKFLIAITNNGQPPLRGPSATVFPSQRKDLASLLQAPCSSPFKLEPTKENINKVTALLNTKDKNYSGKISTFELQSNGDIYINTKACIGSDGRTKINGVNHLVDNVERVSSKFLKINGKLFDTFAAEFQRHKIDKTHNISNSIIEKDFRAVDIASKRKQYYTDGVNYYHIRYYPTSKACLHGHGRHKDTSIELSEFKLESQAEAKFYLSEQNNIRTPDGSYTPFSELNGKLYYLRESGKFVEVPGANPKTLRNIGKKYISHFFTDGNNLIFQGDVIDYDFDLSSFKLIKTGKKGTQYYKIGDYIYHLSSPSISARHGGTLTKTDYDADTFEVLDPTGSGRDRIYQDKNFIYSYVKENKKWKTIRTARK